MKLSVIIPCYNEKENIPLILQQFDEKIIRDDIEVILVNNGSTDGSQKVLDDLIPKYRFARSVRVAENKGYGFGVLYGLNESRGEFIGWTHADMQTDPIDVLRGLRIIEERGSPKNVYVKGNRKKRPLFDCAFTLGMSIFESLYLGELLSDINAQPNIFHRSFYSKWRNPPFDFSLDLFALYQARREQLNIVRFPVLFTARIHGHSSWNTGIGSKWRFIQRTINFSINLKTEIRNGVYSP